MANRHLRALRQKNAASDSFNTMADRSTVTIAQLRYALRDDDDAKPSFLGDNVAGFADAFGCSVAEIMEANLLDIADQPGCEAWSHMVHLGNEQERQAVSTVRNMSYGSQKIISDIDPARLEPALLALRALLPGYNRIDRVLLALQPLTGEQLDFLITLDERVGGLVELARRLDATRLGWLTTVTDDPKVAGLLEVFSKLDPARADAGIAILQTLAGLRDEMPSETLDDVDHEESSTQEPTELARRPRTPKKTRHPDNGHATRVGT